MIITSNMSYSIVPNEVSTALGGGDTISKFYMIQHITCMHAYKAIWYQPRNISISIYLSDTPLKDTLWKIASWKYFGITHLCSFSRNSKTYKIFLSLFQCKITEQDKQYMVTWILQNILTNFFDQISAK